MIEEIKNAICNNDLVFIRENIASVGVNTSSLENDNDTLLQYAISDSKSDAYKVLIELGASLDCFNDIKEGVLHSAVYSGCVERVNELVRDYSVDINTQNTNGVTPLLLALFLEKSEIAYTLIKLGADVNVCDEDNNYPIHIASFYGYKDIIEAIIMNGGNLDIKDGSGNYPISLAINKDRVNVILFLIPKLLEKYK